MKIKHLGQRHALPFGYTPSSECIDSTVTCQLKIANYISSNPEVPVFLESLTEDSHEGSGPVADAIKILFPNGIPSDFNKLNQTQKKIIYEYGAVMLLHLLGKLKNIYKTITADFAAKIDAGMLAGNWYATREESAIEEIKLFATRSPSIEEVILVYGDAHNFTDYCKKNGFEYRKISLASSCNQQIFFNTSRYSALAENELKDSALAENECKERWLLLLTEQELEHKSLIGVIR